MRLALVALLLAGCASARVVTPYSTEDVEKARALCLEMNGVWAETRDEFRCVPLPEPPKERT